MFDTLPVFIVPAEVQPFSATSIKAPLKRPLRIIANLHLPERPAPTAAHRPTHWDLFREARCLAFAMSPAWMAPPATHPNSGQRFFVPACEKARCRRDQQRA